MEKQAKNNTLKQNPKMEILTTRRNAKFLQVRLQKRENNNASPYKYKTYILGSKKECFRLYGVDKSVRTKGIYSERLSDIRYLRVMRINKEMFQNG